MLKRHYEYYDCFMYLLKKHLIKLSLVYQIAEVLLLKSIDSVSHERYLYLTNMCSEIFQETIPNFFSQKNRSLFYRQHLSHKIRTGTIGRLFSVQLKYICTFTAKKRTTKEGIMVGPNVYKNHL